MRAVGKRRWCRRPSVELHTMGEHGTYSYFCAAHSEWSREYDRMAAFPERHDKPPRYLVVLLAEVGDELWIALECAWITLARLRDWSAT